MSKTKSYDIIVIGAGCGGLTAAVCASQNGKKVLLLERHNAPGGFATSFVRGRFEFEASIDMLGGFGNETGLGEMRQIFDDIGINYECVSGNYEERFIKSKKLVNKLLKGK